MGRIVVGVDGSGGALAALRWAMDEAALRGWPVLAVHAYEPIAFGVQRVATHSPVVGLERSARALVDEQVRRARRGHGRDVRVETVVAEGHAAEVLADAALDDDLLVVGSRGRHGPAALLPGSTSRRAAARAHCPVVVVRPEAA